MHSSYSGNVPGDFMLQNVQFPICSFLEMKFLYLLLKFHGYVLNGLREKWIWKLRPEILRADLKREILTVDKEIPSQEN